MVGVFYLTVKDDVGLLRKHLRPFEVHLPLILPSAAGSTVVLPVSQYLLTLIENGLTIVIQDND
jgi:hypothetical protein